MEGVITEAAGEEAVSSLGVSLGETMVAVKKTFFAGDRFSMYCIDHFPKEQLTREQMQSFFNRSCPYSIIFTGTREGRRCGIP